MWAISNLEVGKIGRYDVNNLPINLDHVISFCKSNRKYYPDNVGIPSIRFTCPHASYSDLEWSYETEDARDADFKLLLWLICQK